jgi:hypothetical protein
MTFAADFHYNAGFAEGTHQAQTFLDSHDDPTSTVSLLLLLQSKFPPDAWYEGYRHGYLTIASLAVKPNGGQ